MSLIWFLLLVRFTMVWSHHFVREVNLFNILYDWASMCLCTLIFSYEIISLVLLRWDLLLLQLRCGLLWKPHQPSNRMSYSSLCYVKSILLFIMQLQLFWMHNISTYSDYGCSIWWTEKFKDFLGPNIIFFFTSSTKILMRSTIVAIHFVTKVPIRRPIRIRLADS